MRTQGRVWINLPASFFAGLAALPLGRRLTHLGSTFLLCEQQARVLRQAGVEPVLVRDRHWPHALPLAAFRR